MKLIFGVLKQNNTSCYGTFLLDFILKSLSEKLFYGTNRNVWANPNPKQKLIITTVRRKVIKTHL